MKNSFTQQKDNMRDAILNSEATRDAQALAETYVRLGKDAFQMRLRQMVAAKKLKTIEKLVLVERTRDLLTSNGIIILRKGDNHVSKNLHYLLH